LSHKASTLFLRSLQLLLLLMQFKKKNDTEHTIWEDIFTFDVLCRFAEEYETEKN
jgi:hypothetical protein